MKPLRIFLADDHAMLREGLRFILTSRPGYTVVGESGNGTEALQQIEELKPDVAILDISLPGMTGIEIARQLRKYHPGILIVMLSRHDNEEYLRELLKYRVHAYVLKDEAASDLLRAIEAVVQGETYLSPRMVSLLVKEKEASEKAGDSGLFSLLSNREREILKLLAEGKSGDEIGRALHISPRTVKVHRQNIMKKLDVHKTADLVRYAVRTGLIEN